MLFRIIIVLFGYVTNNKILYPRLNIIVHSTESSHSHLKPLLEISEELSARGHYVTLAARDDKLKYSERYNVSRYSLGTPKPPDFDFQKQYAKLLRKNDVVSKKKLRLLGLPKLFLDDYDNVFFKLDEMINMNRPDLIVCDFASGACSDLAQKYGIPLILGLQTIDVFNLFPMPFMTKTMEYGPISYETLSFLERGYHEVIEPVIKTNFMKALKKMIDLKKAQYGIKPKPTIMGDFNYGLVLANTYFGLEVPMPLPPNVKLIGPLMSKFKAKVDSNLQEFLDDRSRTLYIGFGTAAIPSKKELTAIVSGCIKALNNNIIDGVIWGLARISQSDFPKEFHIDDKIISSDFLFSNSHSKIRLLAYAPQEAILQHPSTILYMTHGGLESFMESLSYAKPMLVVPFVGDQPRNAAKAELMGVGSFIDRHTMSKDSLFAAIIKWTNKNDMKIQFNLQRMKTITQRNSHRLSYAADIIEDHTYLAQACRPFSPYLPEQMFPCEMTHLIPASNFMPWYTKNNMDVYIVLSLFFIIIGYTLSFIPKLLMSFFQNENSSKSKLS